MNKIKLTRKLMNGHKLYKDIVLEYVGNGNFMLSNQIATDNEISGIVQAVHTEPILEALKHQNHILIDTSTFEILDNKTTAFRVTSESRSGIQTIYYEKIIKPIIKGTNLKLYASYGTYNVIIIKHNEDVVGLLGLYYTKL